MGKQVPVLWGISFKNNIFFKCYCV